MFKYDSNKQILCLCLLLIVFNGCSAKNVTSAKNTDFQDDSKICNENFYSGQLLTGLKAEFDEEVPGMIQFNIKGITCVANAKTEAVFANNTIIARFDTMDCDIDKTFRVKGVLNDSGCMGSLRAQHIVNEKNIAYLKKQTELYPLDITLLKEYMKSRLGYLVVDKNTSIFVEIYEPSIFMHKNEFNWNMLKTSEN